MASVPLSLYFCCHAPTAVCSAFQSTLAFLCLVSSSFITASILPHVLAYLLLSCIHPSLSFPCDSPPLFGILSILLLGVGPLWELVLQAHVSGCVCLGLVSFHFLHLSL